MLQAAWFVLGIGVGLRLCDPAFAVFGRIFGRHARGATAGIMLVAGFAITIGWPLTARGASAIGWRKTCLAWAALQVLVGLPMKYWLLPRPTVAPSANRSIDTPVPLDRAMILLAFALRPGSSRPGFPRIFESAGASQTQAMAAGALIDPLQVAACLLGTGLLSRFDPLVSARRATLTSPVEATIILITLSTITPRGSEVAREICTVG
jgi:hypothetical protein